MTMSDQSLSRIGMRLLTMLEAGWRVMRLFARVRIVLPKECFLHMFWMMTEQKGDREVGGGFTGVIFTVLLALFVPHFIATL